MATKPLTQTTGRRKESVARVRLRPGTGVVTVNGRSFENYFPTAMARMVVSEPLRLTSTEEVYDVDATIHGGGVSGQAGALRMGIARSLVEESPENRTVIKKEGYLTRDSRMVERKKFGRRKARRSFQFSKR